MEKRIELIIKENGEILQQKEVKCAVISLVENTERCGEGSGFLIVEDATAQDMATVFHGALSIIKDVMVENPEIMTEMMKTEASVEVIDVETDHK